MLKKLVKYGNSNALVLDKALLELLNIKEGSVVKLSTDGSSLTITPQVAESSATVSKTITPEDASLEMQAKMYGGTPEAKAYVTELRDIYTKYQDKAHALPEEARKKLEKIAEKAKGDYANPECVETALELRRKYCPEFVQMEKAVENLKAKYPTVKDFNEYLKDDNYSDAVEKFKKVHQKYAHIQKQMTEVMQSPEYIHENVLLAEKFDTTKDIEQYNKERMEILSKLVPGYKEYQDEIKAIAESMKDKK